MSRVVVTGMGVISPLGNDTKTFSKNLFLGKLGIDKITKFDASQTSISVAGEVKGFDPISIIGKKATKRMDLFSQYALCSAIEAITQANLTKENTNPDDLGVIYGSGIGGLTTIQQQVIKMHTSGPKRVSPLFVPTSIINMAAANIALHVGAKNVCSAVVTACASATNAIGEAYRYIKENRAQVMLTGGSEASINELGIAGFAALTALSTQSDPKKASLPFDKERSGFVMGEGAATLVLEEYEHAKKRGAKILGEIIGYGTTCDAYHITAPNPNGTQAAKAIQKALTEANLTPKQVGYINAHGTATKANDEGETNSIKLVFGKDTEVLVSSTKSMTGHLLGAAGAIEAVATLKALETGKIPPNIGLSHKDEKCDLNIVSKIGQIKADLTYAISNSLGFGGHNAVLVFKKGEV